MLDWLSSYISITQTENQHQTWLEWQNKQLHSHFIASPWGHLINKKAGQRNMYHRYCFGDFDNLIYQPEQVSDINYITLLLNVYDQCKGYKRTLVGDYEGITLMRTALVEKKMDALYAFDFTPYAYPYHQIHAHTVAYHSLSSLILFFLSNYLHLKSYGNDTFPSINVTLCKNAYNSQTFGDIAYVATHKQLLPKIPKTTNVDIQKPIQKLKDTITRPCNSWPGPINQTLLKCSHCKSVCENYWGDQRHKNCLNCHLYKVCFVCGSDTIFSTSCKTGYPVCIIHTNM